MSKVTADVDCGVCGKVYKVEVEEADLAEFQLPKGARRNIREIFPYLSKAERELFISRTCDGCWQRMFAPEVNAFEPGDLVPENDLPAYVHRAIGRRPDIFEAVSQWYRRKGDTAYYGYLPNRTFVGLVDMRDADVDTGDDVGWGGLPAWVRMKATTKNLNMATNRWVRAGDRVFFVYGPGGYKDVIEA